LVGVLVGVVVIEGVVVLVGVEVVVLVGVDVKVEVFVGDIVFVGVEVGVLVGDGVGQTALPSQIEQSPKIVSILINCVDKLGIALAKVTHPTKSEVVNRKVYPFAIAKSYRLSAKSGSSVSPMR